MVFLRWVYSQWIRFWFTVQMAGHGVLSKPLRSSLTILGVAIGVASVVSLMGIGEGARQAVVRQFESLGSNVIVIKAHDPSVEFEPEEVKELIDRVPALKLATPVVQAEAPMRWRRSRGTASILGVNEQFPQVRDHALIAGHFFTKWHVDQRSPVAVLGYNLGVGLLGGRNPVGETFTLGGNTYTIIGVLAPKGAGQAEDIDDKLLIPYTTAQKIAEKKTVEEIWGKAGSSQEVDLAVVQLGRIFRRKLGLDQSAPTPVPPGGDSGPGMKPGGPYFEGPARAMPIGGPQGQDQVPALGGKDMITITSLNQLVNQADKANRVMTLLLGGIAAVSLLVGGLGIMNIMLVAVTERTSEIGVRRALGAKQTDLLIQFLLEALYLSAIGAIAGVAAGIWGVQMFAQYGFETTISMQAIKIACGVALGAGLLFGVYPAFSASSVPPVEALRR
ncbi:MAG: ABC transporter permease [Bacillota bacterium]